MVDVRQFEPGEGIGKYEPISAELYAALEPHNGADLMAYESASDAAARLATGGNA